MYYVWDTWGISRAIIWRLFYEIVWPLYENYAKISEGPADEDSCELYENDMGELIGHRNSNEICCIVDATGLMVWDLIGKSWYGDLIRDSHRS